MTENKIICADAITGLKSLDSESVECCVTSPPYYGLRDYGVDGQIGIEKTPAEYIERAKRRRDFMGKYFRQLCR